MNKYDRKWLKMITKGMYQEFTESDDDFKMRCENRYYEEFRPILIEGGQLCGTEITRANYVLNNLSCDLIRVLNTKDFFLVPHKQLDEAIEKCCVSFIRRSKLWDADEREEYNAEFFRMIFSNVLGAKYPEHRDEINEFYFPGIE